MSNIMYFKKEEGDSFYTSPLPYVHVLDVPNVPVQYVLPPLGITLLLNGDGANPLLHFLHPAQGMSKWKATAV